MGDEVNASIFIAIGGTFKKHGVKKDIGQFVSCSFGLTCINLNLNKGFAELPSGHVNVSYNVNVKDKLFEVHIGL